MAAKKVKILVREGAMGQTRSQDAPSFLQNSQGIGAAAQAIRVEQQRKRVRRAHTKDRSEVRGGGAKPWRQKGTGRSRHGSRRSPIWVGGGVTFGPRMGRNLKNRIPIRMKQAALGALLAEKTAAGEVEIWKWGKEMPVKTRDLAANEFLRSGTLLILGEGKKDLARAAENLSGINFISAGKLNCSMVISAKYLVLDEDALSVLEKRLGKRKGK